MTEPEPPLTEEELRKLRDEEIEIVMKIRAEREKKKQLDRLLGTYAVCTNCGAPILKEEYDAWESAGCPYCGGDRAVPINLEAAGTE